MTVNPISIKFLHTKTSQPLVSKRSKPDRVQFTDLNNKIYSISVSSGLKENKPKLNFIQKRFNVVIHVKNDDKTGYITVNKNSLLHRLDIASKDLKNATSKNKDYDVTEIVSKKIGEIKEKSSPGFTQLFAEAKRQFSFHPFNEEILDRLNEVLPDVVESNQFNYGRAVMYSTEEQTQKEHAIEDALESFFDRKDLFINLKMNKHGGSVLSRERMKYEILEHAEKTLKSKSPETQKDILNYIRQVAYDRNFLKDPTTFINKWIQDRGGTEILLFPEDPALAFFKKIKFE